MECPKASTRPPGGCEDLQKARLKVDALVFFFANGNIQKNLLGRRGWLDRVKFGLDEYQQLVYLSGPESSEG